MAELEVIKHTKKVYKIWNNKNMSLLHKLGEFLIEIVIIVFAVSLSIWFHSRSEHSHQQQEVKDFLLGLRSDLISDSLSISDSRTAYQNFAHGFSYFASVKINEPISKDSLVKYRNAILGYVYFLPHSGRFEGFKSSGKIGTIEDEELQNDIMDLYQDDISSVLTITELYNSDKRLLTEYLMKNNKRLTDSTTNVLEVLKTDEFINMSRMLTAVDRITRMQDVCLKRMRKIIAEIDRNYSKK
jgi:hypothetical protein